MNLSGKAKYRLSYQGSVINRAEVINRDLEVNGDVIARQVKQAEILTCFETLR